MSKGFRSSVGFVKESPTLHFAQVAAAQARIARHPELGLVVHANRPAAKGARAGAAVEKERLQARCPSADN